MYSQQHAGSIRDPHGEVKHTQILKVRSTFNSIRGAVFSSLNISNCHEYSRKCPLWELLGYGHKPEFRNMNLVKARVVSVAETHR